MAKPKKKYYTVWKGHRTGVFETWDDCKSQITNFEGAQYKSFPTFELAKTALKGNYKDYIGKSKKFSSALSETRLKLIGQPNYNSIAVDAASSGNPGIMEYRGVDTQSKKELFRKGPYQHGTNNVGEFLALVHGLAFLKQNNSDRILYTDSRTAMSWVKKKTMQHQTATHCREYGFIYSCRSSCFMANKQHLHHHYCQMGNQGLGRNSCRFWA